MVNEKTRLINVTRSFGFSKQTFSIEHFGIQEKHWADCHEL